MKHELMIEEVEIPEKVQVTADNNAVTVKGPKGENKREFISNKISINVDGKNVVLSAKNATKREKTMINTFKAHIKNMINGVISGYTYQLKICSGHFPMTVTVKGNEFQVKNFLGEKIPRTTKFPLGVTVKIDGDKVTVDGIDIEKCGQCAGSIELLTRITDKDKRIFQDGIWITSKPQ